MGENPDWRVVRSKMNTEAEFAESLPVGLPSELLLRRPDVRASEQQLRAAMAAAGMAYADRFPRIVFNLTGGWENDDVSGFFRSPFSYVAGTLASPIFGFGRKQARYKAALAAYDEARLGYEQKVLTVFKEANDAVVSYRSVRGTAALKVNLRDAAPEIRRTRPAAIPGREHQLYRRAGCATPLFRRPDRGQQCRARRAPSFGRPLQSPGRRLGGITLRASLVYRYARDPRGSGLFIPGTPFRGIFPENSFCHAHTKHPSPGKFFPPGRDSEPGKRNRNSAGLPMSPVRVGSIPDSFLSPFGADVEEYFEIYPRHGASSTETYSSSKRFLTAALTEKSAQRAENSFSSVTSFIR